MKFLQHFENHQEFHNKHMTISQFENEIFNKRIGIYSNISMQPHNLINCLQFTQVEIENIKKIIEDIFGVENISNPESYNYFYSYRLTFYIGSIMEKIDIYKKDDSWYPVCVHGLSACICDNLDGLEFYLKKASSVMMLINNITKK
jgi:hypothetical protein